MKKAITVFSLAGMTLSLAGSLFAQGAGPKGGPGQIGQGQKGQHRGGMMMMRGKKMQEEIFAKLNLTPDQKNKIDALRKATMEKFKALRSKGAASPDKKGMREQARPIFEAYQKGIKDILTDAQEKKMQQLMEEFRKSRARGGPGGPPPGAPPKGGGG